LPARANSRRERIITIGGTQVSNERVRSAAMDVALRWVTSMLLPGQRRTYNL
jgi:hypothetical protein